MRTLERAAESRGGVSALAAELGVAVAEVERWIAGIPPPPATEIYISALNIVSRIDR
jgi:DNA-binding transcriptional regulator YdaS (Cro superfamily)